MIIKYTGKQVETDVSKLAEKLSFSLNNANVGDVIAVYYVGDADWTYYLLTDCRYEPYLLVDLKTGIRLKNSSGAFGLLTMFDKWFIDEKTGDLTISNLVVVPREQAELSIPMAVV